MLLSSLKPSVGSLPSCYRLNEPSGNRSVSAMLRVNGKASKSTTLQLKGGEEKLQAQETLPAVLRRDVMLLTAVGLALSLPTPVEALEIADVRGIFAGILEARREARRVKARFLKPKTEVDKKAKNESKVELPNAKIEVEGEENEVNATGNNEKPKAESDGEAAKNEGDEKKPRGEAAPPPLLLPNLLNGTPQVAHAQ